MVQKFCSCSSQLYFLPGFMSFFYGMSPFTANTQNAICFVSQNMDDKVQAICSNFSLVKKAEPLTTG
jgi:hypothetical protein